MIFVALAAFGGGLLSALLGWLDSKEPFDGRKFSKSVGVALLTALGFAVGYSFADGVGTKDIFLAVLGGASADSLTNRLVGAIK